MRSQSCYTKKWKKTLICRENSNNPNYNKPYSFNRWCRVRWLVCRDLNKFLRIRQDSTCQLSVVQAIPRHHKFLDQVCLKCQHHRQDLNRYHQLSEVFKTASNLARAHFLGDLHIILHKLVKAVLPYPIHFCSQSWEEWILKFNRLLPSKRQVPLVHPYLIVWPPPHLSNYILMDL